jgi:hypothetical protein
MSGPYYLGWSYATSSMPGASRGDANRYGSGQTTDVSTSVSLGIEPDGLVSGDFIEFTITFTPVVGDVVTRVASHTVTDPHSWQSRPLTEDFLEPGVDKVLADGVVRVTATVNAVPAMGECVMEITTREDGTQLASWHTEGVATFGGPFHMAWPLPTEDSEHLPDSRGLNPLRTNAGSAYPAHPFFSCAVEVSAGNSHGDYGVFISAFKPLNGGPVRIISNEGYGYYDEWEEIYFPPFGYDLAPFYEGELTEAGTAVVTAVINGIPAQGRCIMVIEPAEQGFSARWYTEYEDDGGDGGDGDGGDGGDGDGGGGSGSSAVLGWGTPFSEGQLPAIAPFLQTNEGSRDFSYNGIVGFGLDFASMGAFRPSGNLTVTVRFEPLDGGTALVRVFKDVPFSLSDGKIDLSDWEVRENKEWPFGDFISGVYQIAISSIPCLNRLFLTITSLGVSPGGYAMHAWYAGPAATIFWTGFVGTEEIENGGSNA